MIDTLQCRVCKMYQSVLWLAICDLAVTCTLYMYRYVAINTQLFLEKNRIALLYTCWYIFILAAFEDTKISMEESIYKHQISGKIFDNSDHTGKFPCSEDFIQQSSETICRSVNGVGNGHAERVGEMFKAEESEDNICD